MPQDGIYFGLFPCQLGRKRPRPLFDRSPIAMITLRIWHEPINDPQVPRQIAAFEIAGEVGITDYVETWCNGADSLDERSVFCMPGVWIVHSERSHRKQGDWLRANAFGHDRREHCCVRHPLASVHWRADYERVEVIRI
jgi:hypothetical protein